MVAQETIELKQLQKQTNAQLISPLKTRSELQYKKNFFALYCINESAHAEIFFCFLSLALLSQGGFGCHKKGNGLI